WLGLALGAAALSKLSGLVGVAVALAFMGLRWLYSRESRALISLSTSGVLAALVAGWWYVRNWLLLGDPLGWSAMLPATGDMLRRQPLSFVAAAADLLERGYTGLAVFGWANLQVHWLWYWLGLVAAGWGSVGLLLLGWTAIRQPAKIRANPYTLDCLLLVVWALAFMASLTRWVEVNTAADQWRLLFPAYPALVILLVLGWRRLVRGAERLLAGIPAGLLALNIGALALVVLPAYRGPKVYAGKPEHPMDIRFGDTLQLVGYNTAQPLDAKPGDAVEIDLLWRRTGPLSKDYATDVATVDARGQLTWKEQTIPDEGRAPMTAWPVGATIVDRHRVRARPEMVGSQTLLVSVLDPVPPGNHLPANGGDGSRLPNDSATLGHFVVLPASVAAPQVKDSVSFQDHLELVGHTVVQDRELLRVTLNWKADAPASKDYTVFVHLVAADGKQVAQSDGQPGGGAFPTSLLAAGAEVPDLHILDVTQAPPEDYRLEVGLYDLASGARLSTVRGDSSVTIPIRLT
ncbi:MAG TPA: hypothetical protein VK009_11980, partial [Chloroflexota bacterium]|nr:hypothetical protein [Chloroflexota bacterium]